MLKIAFFVTLNQWTKFLLVEHFFNMRNLLFLYEKSAYKQSKNLALQVFYWYKYLQYLFRYTDIDIVMDI